MTTTPSDGPEPASTSVEEATAALGAWIALEAFTAERYARPDDLLGGVRHTVVPAFGEDGVPAWEHDPGPSEGHVVHWYLPVGAVRVDEAMARLRRAFAPSPDGDEEEAPPRPTGRGKGSRSVAAAVLLDARGRVVDNRFGVSPFAWAVPTALTGSVASLCEWTDVRRGLALELAADLAWHPDGADVVTWRLHRDAQRALVARLRAVEGTMEPTDFAIRMETPEGREDAPELRLSDSWFMDDLGRARDLLSAGRCPPGVARYLGVVPPHARAEVDATTVEALVAPAAFPPVRWPAPGGHSLVSLQQAAVNAARALPRDGSVLAVNGPPGTGKTSLLRDLVAAAVLDRAVAMAAFDDPNRAFSRTNVPRSGPGGQDFRFHRLHPTLLGHEVLVASSNNGAVENVVAELPRRSSVGRDMAYHPVVSDALETGRRTRASVEEGAARDGVTTDASGETWGLVSAALGRSANVRTFLDAFWFDDDVCMATALRGACRTDAHGRPKVRGVPRILRDGRLPTGGEATARWRAARRRLGSLLEEVGRRTAEVQRVRDEVRALEADLATATSDRRPSDVAGLARLKSEIARRRGYVDWARGDLGDRIVDDAWLGDREGRNLVPPWMPDGLHALREDVFEAAMEIHLAFAACAARKASDNLTVATRMLSGMTVGPDIAVHAWASLFAVVPVLSTTFASVRRLLGSVPDGTFGWLVVDEAGQAVPQAAVGAIARARRTVVVGDPSQVEPVVSLPGALVAAVFEAYDLDPDRWAPPRASVQTLADAASPYGVTVRAPTGSSVPRRIGVPLQAQRRSDQPMHSICNAMAYGGRMIRAVPDRPAGPVVGSLGRSRWIDVRSPGAVGRWVPDEGDVVEAILERLAADGVRRPDLFVVTPFRDVRRGIVDRLLARDDLADALDLRPDWYDARIGTVHKVQGREAEAVVVVLGAPGRDTHGARRWATATPNVLNVAVSRAREAVYVVGDRSAWCRSGSARHLADGLPSKVWRPPPSRGSAPRRRPHQGGEVVHVGGSAHHAPFAAGRVDQGG